MTSAPYVFLSTSSSETTVSGLFEYHRRFDVIGSEQKLQLNGHP